MKQRAREAEAMGHSTGKRANLAGEFIIDAHLLRDGRNAFARARARNIVHGREKYQVLAGCQPPIKSLIAASVISELLTRTSAIALDVNPSESSPAARRKNQRGEHAK